MSLLETPQFLPSQHLTHTCNAFLQLCGLCRSPYNSPSLLKFTSQSVPPAPRTIIIIIITVIVITLTYAPHFVNSAYNFSCSSLVCRGVTASVWTSPFLSWTTAMGFLNQHVNPLQLGPTARGPEAFVCLSPSTGRVTALGDFQPSGVPHLFIGKHVGDSYEIQWELRCSFHLSRTYIEFCKEMHFLPLFS